MPEEHVTRVERELATLLSLEPSARLTAGVRARVAKAPASCGWMVWAGATAALVVAGSGATVMWVAGGMDAPVVVRPLPPSRSPAVASAINERVRPAQPRARDDAPRHADEVEVIIDPGLDQAVRRLLREATRQPADGALVLPEAARAVDLAVAPMVVEDLPIPVIKVVEARSLSK